MEIDVKYLLSDLEEAKAEYSVFDNNDVLCYYESTSTFSGYLKFMNFDRQNFIASGLFEFSTAIAGCDTVKITEGRFDLQYTP